MTIKHFLSNFFHNHNAIFTFTVVPHMTEKSLIALKSVFVYFKILIFDRLIPGRGRTCKYKHKTPD